MAGGNGVRRWGRALAMTAGLLLGLFMVWLAVAAVLGWRHAGQARAEAVRVQEQVRLGQHAAAAETLRALGDDTAGIGRWLGGAPWSWLTWLPVAGDTIAAATTIADAVAGTGTPLASAAASVLAAPTADLPGVASSLQAAAPQFEAAARAAAAAQPRVAGIDPDELLGPLAGPLVRARDELSPLWPAAGDAAAASVLLPGLLGLDGPTPWLLVASQPAESRGSGGGFFGAMAVMEGDRGRLRLLQGRPNDDIFDTPVDLSVLPPQFEKLWGPSAAYVWGHNLTRHFPYAATLLAQSAQAFGVQPAYIVALDPRLVAGLLRLTGPVTAAGVTIDDGTAEKFLTSGIYQQFPDARAKDEVVLQLMSALLSQLQSASIDPGDLPRLAPDIPGRLVAWAADPAQQQALERSVLAGALPDAPLTLTAAINNTGGDKLDAYLDSRIDVAMAGGCTTGAQGTVTVRLSMLEVPTGLPDYVVGDTRDEAVYGTTRTMVHVYGPPGAAMESFTVDGQPALASAGTELGRPVWGAELELVPGAQRTLAVGFSAAVPDEPVAFSAQPMLRDSFVTIRDERECLSVSD